MWISIGVIAVALLALGVAGVTTLGRVAPLQAAAAGLRHRQRQALATQAAVAGMAERAARVVAQAAAARDRVEAASSRDRPA